MGMKILDLLLPREVAFFTYMNKQVDNLYGTCLAFKELVAKLKDLNEEEIADFVAQIKSFETKGDTIERHIIQELDKTFITPLDREDIHALVTSIDNSLDRVHSLAMKVEIYKIKRAPQNMIKFADLIVKIAGELKSLVYSLKDRKDTQLYIKSIHSVENEADTLFHVTVAELFSHKKDPIDVIRFKEIYENMEGAVNAMDRIGKQVRGIVLKQG